MPVDFDQFTSTRGRLAELDRQLAENQVENRRLTTAHTAALRSGAPVDVVAGLQDQIRRVIEGGRSIAENRNRIRGEIGGIGEQLFSDPDLLINTLGTDTPVTLLPVRIETRFVSDVELQIRVYPDQVHVYQHVADITPAEAIAAKAYWSSVWTTPEDSGASWQAAAGRLGPERAKFLLDRFEPANLSRRGTGEDIAFPEIVTIENPVRPRPEARLLPSRWLVEILGPDGLRLYRGWFANPVAETIPVSPLGNPLDLPPGEEQTAADDPNAPAYTALSADDPARWLVDFDKAVSVGMATTVRLPVGATFHNGVSQLTVVGVDLSRTPEDGSALLSAHLRAHGYSDGFGLLRPNTASNNTAAAASDFKAGKRDRAAKFAAAADVSGAGADIVKLMCALGSPETVDGFAGFPDAGLSYETTAAALQTALWGTTFGFYLGQFISPLMPDAVIGEVRALVRDHVRPAGPFASIRIGRQPYGVLPVLPPRTSVMLADSLQGGFDKALPEMLQRMRIFIEYARIAGPDGQESSGHTLEFIPNLGHVPEGDTPADVLTRILKLGPLASRIAIRPAAGQQSIINSSDSNSASIARHRKIVELVLANLGFSPAMLALSGKEPPLLDLAVQSSPVYKLLDLPWVAADLSETRSFAASVDKVRQRIADASSDPRSLLGVGPDDAASLIEGLLMLSAAFEYWNAGENHIRDLAIDPGLGAFLLATDFVGFSGPAAPIAGGPALVETPRQMFQLSGAATDNRSLIDFINTSILVPEPPPAMRDAKAFRDAMEVLAERPLWEIDHALRGLLDLGSHRLDAFVTGMATRRLAAIRDNRANGTYLGGYGIVHDLRPEKTPDSEGYIHLPSSDHAVTASILRAGHMANRDDNPDAFNIRLTSSRVRNAIAISEGIAKGQSPGALLGYRFERWLMDDRDMARFILAFRKTAPLPTDTPAAGEPAESVAARDVVDGVALIEAWMRNADDLFTRVEAFISPRPGEPPFKFADAPGERQQLNSYLIRLADIFDAFSDLWTTEAVHQLVRGNAIRSGAALAVIDRQEKPADPQVVMTPRSARGYAQRVIWIAEPTAAAAWPKDLVAAVSASANAIAASLLGDPGRFVVSVRAVDQQGKPLPAPAPVSIRLGDLGLSALSLVLAIGSGTGAIDQATQLEEIIVAEAARRIGAPVTLQVEPTPPRGSSEGTFGFGKLMGLLDAVRRALIGRPALTRRDFATPSGLQEEGIDSALLATDAETLREAVAKAADRLEAGLSDDGLRDEQSVIEGLKACIPLTMRMELWLLAGAAPASAGDLLAAGRDAHKRLKAILDAWAQPGVADPVDQATNRLQLVFGKGFPVLGQITLTPDMQQTWEASLGDQQALRAGLGRRALSRWRRQMAIVRNPMRSLLDALDAAATTGDYKAGESASITQFPHTPGARWAGLRFTKADGVIQIPDVSMSAVIFGAIDPAKPVSGILIDEWTEAIPETKTATSLSFQYDAPGSRPPQAILIAVTPAETVNWSADILLSTVGEALALSKLRLLAPSDIPGAGAVLPTTFIPSNLSAEVPGWKILKNATLLEPDANFVLGKL